MIQDAQFGEGIESRDVLVQLMGGLGNQMFQVATGFDLARSRRSRLWVDHRALAMLGRRRNTTSRSVEVFDFEITAQVPTDESLRAIGLNWEVLPPPGPWIPQRAWTAVQRTVSARRRNQCEVVRERSLNFEPSKFNSLKSLIPIYLVGYWQSAKYFEDCRGELINQFVPSSHLSAQLARLRDEIASSHSLVMHVRRGDLVTNQQAQHFHGLLPVDYYEAAFRFLHDRVPIEHTYVFTDDPLWCRAALKSLPGAMIIDSSRFPGPSAHHLYAMSAGKAFVLANSSFSWWAAWLSKTDPRDVVAPTQWFAGSSDLDGPALPTWTRV